MKNQLLASMLFTAITTTSIAQQTSQVSIGGGLSNTSSKTKTGAYSGNGSNLQADLFIPFLHSGTNPADGSSKFNLGVIAGGSYYRSDNLTADRDATQQSYKLYNGLVNIETEGSGTSNNGFTATAGLQAGFALGKFSVSPSFSGGYFRLKQKGFVQNGIVNGKPVALTGVREATHSGFMTIPQLRISYPVSGNLSVYASTSWLMGPKISTEQLMLVPAGGVNDQQTYEAQQLSAGKMQSSTRETSYHAMNINAGISIGLGNASGRLKGKVTKPGDNGAKQAIKNPLYNGGGTSGTNPMHEALVASPGSPIGGIVVKGGKNPGGNMLLITDEDGGFELPGLEAGSYQFKLTAPDEAQAKSINEKGVKRTAAAIQTPDQPQGKSINEKGVKRVDASAMAMPGQPIGGIVVKGGKNPGGGMTNLMVDDKGTIQFDVLEAGDYKFMIQTPEEPAQQKTKKKVVEKATSGLKDTLKTNV